MSTFVLRKRKLAGAILILFTLIVLTFILGSAVGHASLSWGRMLPAIMGDGTMKEHIILYNIRFPRMLITLLAGMALALSGAIMQAVTRNDLAEPGLVGINAGAGAAIALYYLFAPVGEGYAIIFPLVAFIGGLMTAATIYLFSYQRKVGFNPLNLVLTGVGFSMALSGLMIVLISSADREKVQFISKWLAGNIWGTDWPYILALLPWLIICIPFVFYKMRTLNVLSLDEAVSVGVGVSLQKERLQLIIAAVALASAAVSVTGGISFIGLMAPHIAKSLVGPRSQAFMPVSILLGGWLLLIADFIGRNVAYPEGLSAGIVVALIGAPYFVYLLHRSMK
ncbi:FecCD family ABC transporter permease [Paenibacillus tarimensis]|uniref:FecCD family ABC transporter permease n=1 Tax=Paenibacillus tarimensis TaxID=416012 RepID=UPI001F255079|nr:iron ABC transporter permease [Paenibacillus tarimensis]MCF2944462.1 iron ABC transporter permease [Paenibacillus tarimensis]